VLPGGGGLESCGRISGRMYSHGITHALQTTYLQKLQYISQYSTVASGGRLERLLTESGEGEGHPRGYTTAMRVGYVPSRPTCYRYDHKVLPISPRADKGLAKL
jgi:hypothetical protein